MSLPIHHALEGVSWASLSVRWIPTENQKEYRQQERRDEIEALWLPGERPDVRPPLHPLGGRRFPFERFCARIARRNKMPWPMGQFAARSPPDEKRPAPN